MTNLPHGITIDIDGSGALTLDKLIPGSWAELTFPNLAAAQIPLTFWTAPAPCKVINVVERHVTVAGQAGTMQIEKTPNGTAPGSGTVLLAAAFDLTSTANTNVTKLPSATAPTLIAGDSLGTVLASGVATSYAGGLLTVIVEWLESNAMANV